jgi:catechol-2,3-dioxygenase
MMLEPTAVVLYVDNLKTSTPFYRALIEINPEELSPTFHQFTLTNGMVLGLKVKDTVEPFTDSQNGCGELAFTLDDPTLLDKLFASCQEKGFTIEQSPTSVTFGYTFLMLDPDGNRLRFVSPRRSQ